MNKAAYDAGVQQALLDTGITKLAGPMDFIRALPGRAQELAGQVKPGLAKLMELYESNPAWAQYLMAGGGGALAGAGAGAIGGDAGTGALAGLAAGLGARGGRGLARGPLASLSERGALKELTARQLAHSPPKLMTRLRHSAPARNTVEWLASHPGAATGIGAGAGGLGGLGLGALLGGSEEPHPTGV